MASDSGGCEQGCINLIGSYVCSCQPGYALGSSGFDCHGEQFYASIKYMVKK